jgi:hypothetical protein
MVSSWASAVRDYADDDVKDRDVKEYEAFHNVSDNRGQAIKIEFRLKNGDSEHLEYAYLVRTIIRLGAGKIVLKFTDATVTIEGRNLFRLKEDLRHNKVEWIQEAESEFDDQNQEAVFVRKIAIEDNQP